MAERLELHSTYYPPVGEDTRRVTFDATPGTWDHLKHFADRHPNAVFAVIVYTASQRKARIKLEGVKESKL